MPKTEVIFYKEEDGNVPVVNWLRELPQKPRLKCLAWIRRLQSFGHELRRPYVDYLRDGIYELRVGLHGLNYRVLYFFYGKAAVVLSHGIVKERSVPPLEIDKQPEEKGNSSRIRNLICSFGRDHHGRRKKVEFRRF